MRVRIQGEGERGEVRMEGGGTVSTRGGRVGWKGARGGVSERIG